MAMRLMQVVVAALIFCPSMPSGAEDYYSSDEIVRILKPAPEMATRGIGTRSLDPGTGTAPVPAPGQPGSGSIPDIRVQFPFNSADLTAEARERLDVLGRALVSDELLGLRFEIAGHTDAVGSESYNQTLSERRALSVARYLRDRFGIAPERLESQGYGKRHLLDPTDGPSARNRRVEVVTIE